MTKIESDAMLVLLNKTIEPSNVRKKWSHVMLKLHNVRMKPSNEKKKIKGTNKCDKRIITYDVGTA